MERYPIWLENKQVGWAEVERQGLLWVIRCGCEPVDVPTPRVCAGSGEQTIDLGRLVPEGRRMTLVKRVACKSLEPANAGFRITEAKQEERWIELRQDMPFGYIEMLQNARYCRKEGRSYVVIQESSSPTGQ